MHFNFQALHCIVDAINQHSAAAAERLCCWKIIMNNKFHITPTRPLEIESNHGCMFHSLFCCYIHMPKPMKIVNQHPDSTKLSAKFSVGQSPIRMFYVNHTCLITHDDENKSVRKKSWLRALNMIDNFWKLHGYILETD